MTTKFCHLAGRRTPDRTQETSLLRSEGRYRNYDLLFHKGQKELYIYFVLHLSLTYRKLVQTYL